MYTGAVRGTRMSGALVRLVAFLAGAGLIAVALAIGLVGPAQDALSYRHAPLCRSGVRYAPALDCIGGEDDTVTHVRHDVQDAGNGPIDEYYVYVKRASGAVQKLSVERDIYDAASQGHPVRLRLWHGNITEVTANGAVSYVGSIRAVVWLSWAELAWIALGLVLWGLLDSGTFEDRGPVLTVRFFVWAAQGLANIVAAYCAIFWPRDSYRWLEITLGACWTLAMSAFMVLTFFPHVLEGD